MKIDKAPNLLGKKMSPEDLKAVVLEATKPRTVPMVALRSGQPFAMANGDRYAVIDPSECAAPDHWDRPETVRESVEKLKPLLKAQAAAEGTPYGNTDAIVVQGASPNFEILGGKCRWVASKELGLKIVALILGKPKVGAERRAWEVMHNRSRTDLNSYETILAADYLEKEGHSVAAIADALCRTRQAVYGYLKVARNPELLEKVRTREITLADAKDDLTFHRIVPIDEEASASAGTTDPESSEKGAASRAAGQVALKYVPYDPKRRFMGFSLRLKTASKAEKKKALRALLEMYEFLNSELNPLDPRKKDRRTKEAVTPEKRRKLDRD